MISLPVDLFLGSVLGLVSGADLISLAVKIVAGGGEM